MHVTEFWAHPTTTNQPRGVLKTEALTSHDRVRGERRLQSLVVTLRLEDGLHAGAANWLVESSWLSWE
jgi:hypothetical protein